MYKKFKVGEIVVIKDKDDKVWKKYGSISHFEPYLGKQYKILSLNSSNRHNNYILENCQWGWFTNELLSLSDIRKKKLNKIKNAKI